MATPLQRGSLSRVGEYLYRYSSNGIYYARFRSNGKLIKKSLETSDREMAKRKLKEELAKGSRIDPKLARMLLSDLLDYYEKHLGQFAPKTIATRKSILKIFKATWQGGTAVPVKTISTGQMEMWLSSQKGTKKNSTFNEYARFLRHVFDLAVKLRVLGTSPAAGIKGLKVETPVRNSPTWEQFQAIVQNIRGEKFNRDAEDSGDLVEFMGLAGIGTAECAGLEGEHINFAGNRITLYRNKTDVGYTIPIFPQVLPLLTRLETKGQIKHGERVFKITDPKKALAGACKRLGLPAFSPRSLRRCFITRAIELGVDFKTIASWQGHQDGGVLIAKTYSHLRSEHSDAMARKLAV